MRSITTRFRYWLPLLALLLSGACQRASYSFQAPLGSLLLPAAATGGAVVPAPAASYCGLSPQQVASRPKLRHVAVAARRRPKSLARLQLLPLLARQAVVLPRASSRVTTQQEPTLGASPAHWRTRGIALLLALFLGGIGGHLFYLGYYGRAVAYLVASVVGLLLLTIAFVLALASILGGGGGFVALAIIGAIISGGVSLLALVDAIRIAIGDLKPKNGEYFPKLFQTHNKP